MGGAARSMVTPSLLPERGNRLDRHGRGRTRYAIAAAIRPGRKALTSRSAATPAAARAPAAPRPRLVGPGVLRFARTRLTETTGNACFIIEGMAPALTETKLDEAARELTMRIQAAAGPAELDLVSVA